jgi:hypothetical protein
MGVSNTAFGDPYMHIWGPTHAHLGTHTCTFGDPHMHTWGPTHAHLGTHTCTFGDPHMHIWGPIHAHLGTHTCTFGDPYMHIFSYLTTPHFNLLPKSLRVGISWPLLCFSLSVIFVFIPRRQKKSAFPSQVIFVPSSL